MPWNASCFVLGKQTTKAWGNLYQTYQKRLKHYTKFSLFTIDDIKNSKHLSEAEQKQREGKALQKHLKAGDRIILLDEGGKSFTSLGFAEWINKQLSGVKRLVFIVGGPYGFSEELYQLANKKLVFLHDLFPPNGAPLFLWSNSTVRTPF